MAKKRKGRKKRWLKKKDRQTVGFLIGIIFIIGVCYQPIAIAIAVAAPAPAVPTTETSQVDAVLSLAAKQVGTKESPARSNKQKYGAEYGWNGVAWCAQFVWWSFDRAAAGGALPKKSASVYEMRDAFQKAGRFDMNPQPGDVVIFDYGQGHTGIVKSVQDKTITTIEGNTSSGDKGSQNDGGMVAERTRPRDSHIVGYGHPNFAPVIKKVAFGPLSSKYNDLFEKEGSEHGVSPILLAAMAKQESGFNPKAGSDAGAKGLMQFMPATAKGYGIDPWVPEQAVDGAARKMADLLKEFNGNTDFALAGYNAGSSRVRQFGGVPPKSFAEGQTYNYVKNINEMVKSAS